MSILNILPTSDTIGPDGRMYRHFPLPAPVVPQGMNTANGQQDFYFGDAAMVRLSAVVAATQGASPSLALTTYGSPDGVTWTQITAFSAITGTGTSRLLSLADKYFRLAWVISGASRLSAITAAGTTPPTVTISGTPSSLLAQSLRIEITTGGTRGTALFRWSLDGGTTWVASGVATAASVALGTSGITAAFATGTYATDNVYTATITIAPGFALAVSGAGV